MHAGVVRRTADYAARAGEERRVTLRLGGGDHPVELFRGGLILDHPHHDLLGAFPAL
jgi:hypothetical protein